MFLPDPHRKTRSFEAGMQRLEQMKKTAKPPEATPDEQDEIFGHIPPAPAVKD